VDMEPEKTRYFFRCLERIRLSFLKRQKFSLTMGGVALLHGIIKSHNGLNIKFSNNWRSYFNWPLIENSINLPDKWVYLPKENTN
jgi:hypothetical protein